MIWNKIIKKMTLLGIATTIFAGSFCSGEHVEARLFKKGKYMNNNAELTVNTTKTAVGCDIYYPVKTNLEINTSIYIPKTNGKYRKVNEYKHTGTFATTQIGIYTSLSSKDRNDGKIIIFTKTSAKVSDWQFVENGETKNIYTDWAQ